MASAAHEAGLTSVHAEERPVDVGVTEPGQLVRYRFGRPIFAAWLDAAAASLSGGDGRRGAGQLPCTSWVGRPASG
jgi:hypothetical protein